MPWHKAQALHKVQRGADAIRGEMAAARRWMRSGATPGRAGGEEAAKEKTFWQGPEKLGVEWSDLQNVALVRLRELDDVSAGQREAPDIVELCANAIPMEQLFRADESPISGTHSEPSM